MIMDISIDSLRPYIIGIIIVIVIFTYQKNKNTRKKYQSQVQATILKLKEEGYEEELLSMKIEDLEAMYMKFVDMSEFTYEEKVVHSAKGDILYMVLEGLGSDIDALELKSFDEDF